MSSLPTPRILTVTELTRSIRGILETEFPFVTVIGEVSNLRQPFSGHLYFTLKDEDSQLKAVLFKHQQKYLREQPEDGQQLICRGRVSVYEARGEYQLIVDYVERYGLGELQAAFEDLKQKLAREGLFDQSHKKVIPSFPTRVTVITSSEGAALHDFLKVALHRFPAQPIEIYPVRVQGREAAQEISSAIETANRIKRSDVIVLCRGGGSIEDLWPFNEEIVARAIYHSSIPIVTGIGHEIDFTIADLAADVRAPTPTAAAELVVPSKKILSEHIHRLQQVLVKTSLQLLQFKRHRVMLLQGKITDPRTLISYKLMHLDNLISALMYNYKSYLHSRSLQLESLSSRLDKISPVHRLAYQQQWTSEVFRRLQLVTLHRLQQNKDRLKAAAALLEAFSPLKVLGRGYAIVRSGPHETPPAELIRSNKQATIGKNLEVTLQDGSFGCEVTEIKNNGRDERI